MRSQCALVKRAFNLTVSELHPHFFGDNVLGFSVGRFFPVVVGLRDIFFSLHLVQDIWLIHVVGDLSCWAPLRSIFGVVMLVRVRCEDIYVCTAAARPPGGEGGTHAMAPATCDLCLCLFPIAGAFSSRFFILFFLFFVSCSFFFSPVSYVAFRGFCRVLRAAHAYVYI